VTSARRTGRHAEQGVTPMRIKSLAVTAAVALAVVVAHDVYKTKRG
jgi:hypothetical protein